MMAQLHGSASTWTEVCTTPLNHITASKLWWQPYLIPYSDLKPLIATYIKSKCNMSGMETLTNCVKLNHLWENHHRCMQEVSGTKWSLAWMAILDLHMFSYSRGNHLPECIECQSIITLKHILLACVDIWDLHEQFYLPQVPGNMHDLFLK